MDFVSGFRSRRVRVDRNNGRKERRWPVVRPTRFSPFSFFLDRFRVFVPRSVSIQSADVISDTRVYGFRSKSVRSLRYHVRADGGCDRRLT